MLIRIVTTASDHHVYSVSQTSTNARVTHAKTTARAVTFLTLSYVPVLSDTLVISARQVSSHHIFFCAIYRYYCLRPYGRCVSMHTRGGWQALRMRENRVLLVIARSCEPVCLQRSTAKVNLRRRPFSLNILNLITCLR